ncbi:MAG: hypothetical protein JW757_04360 [Anaerolineales bacterium]|nr:hypothetical protein [Anaerolineales bacterium]
MKIFLGALITGIAIASFIYMRKIAPDQSKLVLRGERPHFPVVSGNNLNRETFEFPRDFSGDLNLVIIPFQQKQQAIVNTWIPFAQEVEGAFPGFIYYELPTIYELPTLSRTFINEGMRAGIPDETTRQRTITLYLDKESFKEALDIQTENEVHLFLIDKDGEILWSGTGEYTPEKAESLLNYLRSRSN